MNKAILQNWHLMELKKKCRQGKEALGALLAGGSVQGGGSSTRHSFRASCEAATAPLWLWCNTDDAEGKQESSEFHRRSDPESGRHRQCKENEGMMGRECSEKTRAGL